jgi:hypothetical protein
MATLQIEVPDSLHHEVEAAGLVGSELFARAARAELRRRRILAETEAWIARVEAEEGPPTEEERARASALALRIGTVARRDDAVGA